MARPPPAVLGRNQTKAGPNADAYVVTGRIADPVAGGEIEFRSRRALPESKPRLVHLRDFGGLARLGLYAAAARLSQPQRWSAVADAIPHRRGRSARRRIEAGLSAYFGDQRSPAELTTISGEYRRAEARRLMLNAVEAVGGWRPQISIAGLERIAAALAHGRGAILWCEEFLFQSLVGKRALFEAGYAAHQVTVVEHGYSRSRFGRFAINGMQQRQEARYLNGRLVFDRLEGAGIGARVRAILRKRGLVLITNNTYSGRRFVSLPFGANGRIRVAAGPLRLAQLCDAPLFPFVLFEVEPFRRYEAMVGEELPLGRLAGNGDGNGDAALVAALVAYRTWLEPHLSRAPEQWMRWTSLAADRPGESAPE
jgi:lauroyl/myristoyl acyltransferase